ncbi:MAG TPA: hypothetical protein VJ961_04765 [Mariprofundaceae bacterium]|nr:hypothetical protein [Mariprofundaceae bacterium]
MEVQYNQAAWGVAFAALMYVIGNGVWVNHLARSKQWKGWLLWVITAALVLVGGAAIDTHLMTHPTTIWQRLSTVDQDNHWIIVTLFAILSSPGAASVIFKQSNRWTRLALIVPAIIVFIPAGMLLGGPNSNDIIAGLGLTLAVCAIVFVWQLMLDKAPEAKKTKVA